MPADDTPAKISAARQARLEWARKQWEGKLKRRVLDDHSVVSGCDYVAELAKADPSPQGQYISWIFRTYASGAFLFEDVERIEYTLRIFDQWKHRLPVDQRDIGRFKDEHSLWVVMEPFDPARRIADETSLQGRALRRLERLKAYSQSEFAEGELEGWVCLRPLTHFAARWWGRGTRWCTAMERARYFKSYDEKGPLRILIDPDGNKYQLHMSTGSFADANDHSLNIHHFAKRLPKGIIEVLKGDIERFMCLFTSHLSHGQVALDPHDLIRLCRQMPIELMDEDKLEAIREEELSKLVPIAEGNGFRLHHVSRELMAWAMGLWRETVHAHFLVLEHADEVLAAPINNRDKMIELGKTVSSAPTPFRVEAATAIIGLYRSKVGFKSTDAISWFLKGFGEQNLPQHTWVTLAGKLAKANNEWYEYAIPARFIDDEVADALATGTSIIPIPKEKLTRDRVLSVLARASRNVVHELNSLGMDWIWDREMAMLVATDKSDGITRVPRKFLDREFCREVLLKKPAAIEWVNPDMLDRELCLAAVRINGNIIDNVPGRFRHDREMWLTAVGSSPVVLGRMPEEYKDEEACRLALRKAPDLFMHANIPLTYEEFKAGVQINGSALSAVPLPYRDADMCVAALDCQRDAIAHVPPLVAKLLREDGRYGELLTHLDRRLSARYAPDDPIRTFLPTEEKPERMMPVLKVEANANVAGYTYRKSVNPDDPSVATQLRW